MSGNSCLGTYGEGHGGNRTLRFPYTVQPSEQYRWPLSMSAVPILLSIIVLGAVGAALLADFDRLLPVLPNLSAKVARFTQTSRNSKATYISMQIQNCNLHANIAFKQ